MKNLIKYLIPKALLKNYIYQKRKKELPQETGKLEKDIALYWGSSDKSEMIQSHSHWRGIGEWGEEKWIKAGEYHWKMVENYLLEYDPDFLKEISQYQALEWGQGGGANMRLLCTYFDQAWGVDISAQNLDECEKQMKALNLNNFNKVLFDSENPELVQKHIPPKSLGFILCTAVFQHFPSIEYGKKVLKVMKSLMQDRAYALIQIRFDDGSAETRPNEKQYFKNVLTFTSHPKGEFEKQLEEIGLKSIVQEVDARFPKARYEYHFIKNIS